MQHLPSNKFSVTSAATPTGLQSSAFVLVGSPNFRAGQSRQRCDNIASFTISPGFATASAPSTTSFFCRSGRHNVPVQPDEAFRARFPSLKSGARQLPGEAQQRKAIQTHRATLHQNFVQRMENEHASLMNRPGVRQAAVKALLLCAANRDLKHRMRAASALLREGPDYLKVFLLDSKAGWFALLEQVDRHFEFQTAAVQKRLGCVDPFTGQWQLPALVPHSAKLSDLAMEFVSTMGVWYSDATSMPLSPSSGPRSVADAIEAATAIDRRIESLRSARATGEADTSSVAVNFLLGSGEQPVFETSDFIAAHRMAVQRAQLTCVLEHRQATGSWFLAAPQTVGGEFDLKLREDEAPQAAAAAATTRSLAPSAVCDDNDMDTLDASWGTMEWDDNEGGAASASASASELVGSDRCADVKDSQSEAAPAARSSVCATASSPTTGGTLPPHASPPTAKAHHHHHFASSYVPRSLRVIANRYAWSTEGAGSLLTRMAKHALRSVFSNKAGRAHGNNVCSSKRCASCVRSALFAHNVHRRRRVAPFARRIQSSLR